MLSEKGKYASATENRRFVWKEIVWPLVIEHNSAEFTLMQYQKKRNQGGTMSYQQFKMTVLKQAQGQGPMAQGQPQMAAKGGRIGYQRGGPPGGGGVFHDTAIWVRRA